MRSDIISKAINTTFNEDGFWVLLIERSKAKAGPFDGNCLTCARAIIHAVGSGSLVRIISDLSDGQAEHYGAMVSGVIYDFDGPAKTPVEWVERFRRSEQVYDRECLFAHGLGRTDMEDDHEAVEAISNLLLKSLV